MLQGLEYAETRGQTYLEETGSQQHGKVALQTSAQAGAAGLERMYITAEGNT